MISSDVRRMLEKGYKFADEVVDDIKEYLSKFPPEVRISVVAYLLDELLSKTVGSTEAIVGVLEVVKQVIISRRIGAVLMGIITTKNTNDKGE